MHLVKVYWFITRMFIGEWFLRKAMNIMPRCDLRDDLRMTIIHIYYHHREGE